MGATHHKNVHSRILLCIYEMSSVVAEVLFQLFVFLLCLSYQEYMQWGVMQWNIVLKYFHAGMSFSFSRDN